jgi:hypothetical protein
MDVASEVLEQGPSATTVALRAWNRRPGPVLRRWLFVALGAAVLLLGAVLVIAAVSPGRGPVFLHQPPLRVGTLFDVRQIVSRNLLVLALHALACVAGFIAGSRVPREAGRLTGWRRAVHRHGARVGILFVIAATVTSLGVQAATIGSEAARVAASLGTSPACLIVALLPHALPELTALFLPLAAWIIASRRGEWDQLLAATAVTVALAAPVLLVCAFWEVYGAPHVIHALVGHP